MLQNKSYVIISQVCVEMRKVMEVRVGVELGLVHRWAVSMSMTGFQAIPARKLPDSNQNYYSLSLFLSGLKGGSDWNQKRNKEMFDISWLVTSPSVHAHQPWLPRGNWCSSSWLALLVCYNIEHNPISVSVLLSHLVVLSWLGFACLLIRVILDILFFS